MREGTRLRGGQEQPSNPCQEVATSSGQQADTQFGGGQRKKEKLGREVACSENSANLANFGTKDTLLWSSRTFSEGDHLQCQEVSASWNHPGFAWQDPTSP